MGEIVKELPDCRSVARARARETPANRSTAKAGELAHQWKSRGNPVSLTLGQTLRILPVVKIVGKRPTSAGLAPFSPEESLRRAILLQAQAELLNPYPRPRRLVFKAKTREDYERW